MLKKNFENFLCEYSYKLKKYPQYSNEQEKLLAKAAANGDFEARKKLIEANLYLVVKILRTHFHKYSIPVADLIQEGNMGLMYAMSKYNPNLNTKFGTYATWWIRQFMFKAISEQSLSVKIPVYVQETISKYNKIKRELENKNNGLANEDEIAEIMNIKKDKMMFFISSVTTPVSLDGELQSDSGKDTPLSDLIPDEKVQEVFKSLEDKEMKNDLQKILETLKKREIIVLTCHFGLNDTTKRTLEEIGKFYGVTKECIRQTEKRAIQKIRTIVNTTGALKEYACMG